MKINLLLLIIVFYSCSNSQNDKINTNEFSEIDSIISKSQESLTIVGVSNKKSDSLVTGKVENTVNKISNLETEVKELKYENKKLKNQLDDINDNGEPFIIRTISDN